MESEAKYVLVGAFILLSTVAVFVALFWISDISDVRSVRYYVTYIKHQNLSGLQKDSSVTMKGIKIGSVDEYQISQANIEEVKVLLKLDRAAPVKKDTTVVIRRNLLTGLATLDLVGSTQESPPLTAVPEGETYPVIPEGSTRLDKLADTLPETLNQISTGFGRAASVLTDQNLHAVEATLRNAEKVSASMARSSDRIESVLTALEGTLRDISELSRTTKAAVHRLDEKTAAVSDAAAAALRTLDASLKDFDRKSQEIAQAVRSSSQIFSQEVAIASQSISQAAAGFSRTMEGFENPRRLISGPAENALGPGEKKK